MSYLDNTTVTIDAILTKRGRELFSQGNFNVTKFALADDEVDYGLYDKTHPSGSDYYSVAIDNLPMLEAIPDGSKIMRFKLITLPKGSAQIPLITVPSTTIQLRAKYAGYPGATAIINPSTVNGLNEILGYTATIYSTQYVSLAVASGGSGGGNGGGGGGVILNEEDSPVNRAVNANAGINTIITAPAGQPGASVIGKSFLIQAKEVPDDATYTTTLTIVGNETGGSVSITINVKRGDPD